MKQALLRSVLPDGTDVLLVVLHDDHCAVLRNNKVVHVSSGDADGIDAAVQQFMALTHVSDVLGGEESESTTATTSSSLESTAGLTRVSEPVASPPANGAPSVASSSTATPRSPV